MPVQGQLHDLDAQVPTSSFITNCLIGSPVAARTLHTIAPPPAPILSFYLLQPNPPCLSLSLSLSTLPLYLSVYLTLSPSTLHLTASTPYTCVPFCLSLRLYISVCLTVRITHNTICVYT